MSGACERTLFLRANDMISGKSIRRVEVMHCLVYCTEHCIALPSSCTPVYVGVVV